MIELDVEYIKYLEDNIKHFNDELIELVELPDVSKLRSRINKDKRDTQDMLDLYGMIEAVNDVIRAVKAEMRDCIKQARELLRYGLKRAKKRPDNIDTSSYSEEA